MRTFYVFNKNYFFEFLLLVKSEIMSCLKNLGEEVQFANLENLRYFADHYRLSGSFSQEAKLLEGLFH